MAYIIYFRFFAAGRFCKAQIPLGSSRHVSTRLDTLDIERVATSVSSVSSRAVPTWRTTNKLYRPLCSAVQI